MFNKLLSVLRIFSFLLAIFITTGCGVKGDLTLPSDQNTPNTEQTSDDSEEQS
ncbi:LPS translocon maturation chaperone LptM [Aliiglaciecola lipolytica]|uniref:Lipoprotein n=1 Tax=Aliiglaciecola lipolytica E3 TaxID=1127673 RepID=K6YBF8_9ALTE|nr:lipoprotein [Aliiglaciecola lipolytica]GAC15522.1 hypothetical protein GLIP_2901 [Aliiglaciecola lipolytica E3]